jgi:integrase
MIQPLGDYRHRQSEKRYDPFICSLQHATIGDPLNRHVLRRRFHTACRVLGWDRLRTLTIHHGRHTFISHALAGGRSVAGYLYGGRLRPEFLALKAVRLGSKASLISYQLRSGFVST